MKKILAIMIALFLFSAGCTTSCDTEDDNPDANNGGTTTTKGGGTTTPVTVQDALKSDYAGTWKFKDAANDNLTIFSGLLTSVATLLGVGSNSGQPIGEVEITNNAPGKLVFKGEFELENASGTGEIELDYGTDIKRVDDYIVVKAKVKNRPTLTVVSGGTQSDLDTDIGTYFPQNKEMVIVFVLDPTDTTKLTIYINYDPSFTSTQVNNSYNNDYNKTNIGQTIENPLTVELTK